MQRQSLGSSPTSLKLHHHHLHGIILNADLMSPSPSTTNSPKHKSSPPSSSPSSPTKLTSTPHRFSITPSSATSLNAEKLIHLIPIFTLLCFLLLFLLSHNPSPSDMAKFPGVKPMQTAKTDVAEIELDGLKSTITEQIEMDSVGLVGEKRDVLGIRSFRNLQENEEQKYGHFKINNRKLGDF